MTENANQAIGRLARALQELSYRGRISIKPEIRMLLCPGEPTPEDAPHMHAIGFTPEIAGLLADAVERLLDTDAPSAPLSAHIFALVKPELTGEIRSAFAHIDPDALARAVLADTAPQDRPTVTRALAAMFRTTEDDQHEDGDDA
jgi:hypothetical protein